MSDENTKPFPAEFSDADGDFISAQDEVTVAIPADPDDPEDRDVTVAVLKRAHMGRFVRTLRHRLGLSQAEFAERYGIPVANIRQYEIGRTMPPPAVRSYLKVISAEPDRTAQALAA
ncbi:MAG: helix-turn-helix domain-containing protein [Sphingomonadaceae bacterium]|nr:helix-turn-helix domain-containing protein [Sphingomonadaceae bacterium]